MDDRTDEIAVEVDADFLARLGDELRRRDVSLKTFVGECVQNHDRIS